MTEVHEPVATYSMEDAGMEVLNLPQLGEPETAKPKRWGKPFEPCQVANPYGRKGNPEKRTMVTEVRRKADKQASKLADAAVKSALNGNVRALTFIRDTAYGVPAQKLVVAREEDPAATLLARMLEAERPQLPPAS